MPPSSMRKAAPGGLVYSTEGGRMCPACRRPVARETKGRGGKAVTVVRGVPVDAATLAALGRQLRTVCGSGGTVKDGAIEL